MCVCVCVYYLSLKSIRVSIKLPIFKPFITILSTYNFFKVTCDIGIAQCKYRIVKCDVSDYLLVSMVSQKKCTIHLPFKFSFIRASTLVVLNSYIAIFSTTKYQNVPYNGGAKTIFFWLLSYNAQLLLAIHCS